jgi:hypothetical protein
LFFLLINATPRLLSFCCVLCSYKISNYVLLCVVLLLNWNQKLWIIHCALIESKFVRIQSFWFFCWQMQLQGFYFSTSSTHVVHKLNTILTSNPFAFFSFWKFFVFIFCFFLVHVMTNTWGLGFLLWVGRKVLVVWWLKKNSMLLMLSKMWAESTPTSLIWQPQLLFEAYKMQKMCISNLVMSQW